MQTSLSCSFFPHQEISYPLLYGDMLIRQHTYNALWSDRAQHPWQLNPRALTCRNNVQTLLHLHGLLSDGERFLRWRFFSCTLGASTVFFSGRRFYFDAVGIFFFFLFQLWPCFLNGCSLNVKLFRTARRRDVVEEDQKRTEVKEWVFHVQAEKEKVWWGKARMWAL